MTAAEVQPLLSNQAVAVAIAAVIATLLIVAAIYRAAEADAEEWDDER